MEVGLRRCRTSLLVSKKVSVGAKLTYAVLLKYAWQNDFCFPGQKRLADDIGVTKRSLFSFVKELEKAGFIKIQRRGQDKANQNILNLKARKRTA